MSMSTAQSDITGPVNNIGLSSQTVIWIVGIVAAVIVLFFALKD